MKNQRTISGGAALIILLLMALAPISMFGQEDEVDKVQTESQTASRNRNDDARQIEGVWNVQVTIRNCQTGEAVRTISAMNRPFA